MTGAPLPAHTILLVDGDAGVRSRLAAALDGFARLEATSAAEALDLLAANDVDLVLAEYRLPDGNGLDLLEACRERRPDARRLLVAAWADVPNLVRARASGLVQRVVQRATRRENVRRIVDEALGVAAPPRRVAGDRQAAWQEMEELLRWTAARATQIPGVVIRQLSPNAADLQLQLVVPPGPDYEAFRAEVVQRWLWPLKPRNGAVAANDEGHPVLAHLGELEPEHEVYAKRVEPDLHVYLALLPWRREPRVTAALGIHRPKFLEMLHLLLVDVHRFAVEEVAELPLPTLPPAAESTGPGQTVLEYDWVVTDSYVGPDRRGAPTPFLNRFSLIGRRRRVPSRAAKTADAYVDRLAPWVRWYAVACFALSAIDTALTLFCVRRGLVGELNPLLRPLVLHRPWVFLAVKNLLTLAAFLLVARFQLFRIGRLLLGAMVLAFALLDAYWVYVLL